MSNLSGVVSPHGYKTLISGWFAGALHVPEHTCTQTRARTHRHPPTLTSIFTLSAPEKHPDPSGHLGEGYSVFPGSNQAR